MQNMATLEETKAGDTEEDWVIYEILCKDIPTEMVRIA
jgi:hypothetical protein